MGLLRERINQVAGARLKDDDLLKKVRIDARLDLAEIQGPFIDSYARLAPFGVGNPKPTFLSEGVEVVGSPQVLQGKHLKFLARQNDRMIEVLAWDRKEWIGEVRKGGCLDVVYSLRSSTFLGEEKYSLSLEAFKASEK
jgi:single-stranded-DNA-specific exonuclease